MPKEDAGGAAIPQSDRPEMPADYGIQRGHDGQVSWSDVMESLAQAHNYWVGTTRPDGRPHVMPVWGLWLDGMFYFGTDRRSRKGRNLEENPAITVHLESAEDVVILEGTVVEAKEPSVVAAIDEAYLAKYGMRVSGHPGPPVLYGVSPRTVFAWREKDFPVSATRWRLGR